MVILEITPSLSPGYTNLSRLRGLINISVVFLWVAYSIIKLHLYWGWKYMGFMSSIEDAQSESIKT